MHCDFFLFWVMGPNYRAPEEPQEPQQHQMQRQQHQEIRRISSSTSTRRSTRNSTLYPLDVITHCLYLSSKVILDGS